MRIPSSNTAIAALALALAGTLLAAWPLAATQAPTSLVRIVREATRPYVDISNAAPGGYGRFLGCVSSPEEGAMGVHYVNGPLVGDGQLDAERPEALIYEFSNGRARLVGVEFIVDAAQWLAANKTPPVLEGQSFHYVGSPNRYGIPPFFELHVWAWRDNPKGMFVDWNPRVSCEGRGSHEHGN